MKKTNLFLGALAVLLAGSLVVTGCKQEPEPEPEVVNYTVTFDLNYDGATDAPAAQTVAENGTATKPETDPTRTGYDFAGWYNGEAEYDFTAAVTSDLTLKASWTVTKYTITYDVGEGTNAEANPAEYTIESDDITLADPTGPAATPNFVAWHVGTADGDKVTGVAIAKGSTGNKTFVAEFSAKAIYKVTYYDGETSVGTENVVEGEKAAGKAIAKDGYDFDAWYTDADCTTKATFDSAVTADVSIYGKWIKKVTVTFKNGDEVVDTKVISSGATVEAPAAINKDGYTFGWYNGETAYAAATTYTADTTYTAKWTAIKYKITYELNEGTNYADAPETYTIEDEVTLGTPTKEGKDFIGWTSSKSLGSTVSQIKKGSTGDITFTARFGTLEAQQIDKTDGWAGTTVLSSTPLVSTITYSSAWGEAQIKGKIDTTVYTGVNIEFEEIPTDVQFEILCDDDKTQCYANITSTTLTYTFANYDTVKDQANLTPKLQAKTATAVAKVKSATLTKADGTTEDAALAVCWGCTITTEGKVTAGKITFAKQWGSAAELADLDITGYIGYKIILNEAFSADNNVRVTVYYVDADNEKADSYGNIYLGNGSALEGTEFTVFFDDVPDGKTINAKIQANAGDTSLYPMTLDVKGVYLVKE